jgi:hypothetical protein
VFHYFILKILGNFVLQNDFLSKLFGIRAQVQIRILNVQIILDLSRSGSESATLVCLISVQCTRTKGSGGRSYNYKVTVPYRHGGGWSKKINAWYLDTLMVYL